MILSDLFDMHKFLGKARNIPGGQTTGNPIAPISKKYILEMMLLTRIGDANRVSIGICEIVWQRLGGADGLTRQ
jgi:hypothetical protein